jgi:RNA polymerase sigma factor (sigma-70 family)
LKVWNRRDGVREIRNFSGYLFVSARNLVFDYLKKISEEAAAKKEFVHGRGEGSLGNEAENLMIEAQYEELLNKEVERLPPQQKQVFKLARVDGLSHEDIAKMMNISRLTVKRHMASALQTIRFRLKNHLS